MATVAFIGPDGTGKTTIARRLAESGLLPFKYLYMGVNVEAASVSLPTARFVARVKRRLVRSGAGSDHPVHPRPGGQRHYSRSWLWGVARLTHHFVDEWLRQFVSWYYQARGFVVLYDRHFAFDFAPQVVGGSDAPADRRVHHWLATHAYPRPDLVFFLDAPGEVLFARKGELSAGELERLRRAFAEQGIRLPNFIRVDTTQPLDDVYQEIVSHLALHFNLQLSPPGAAERRLPTADRAASCAEGVPS